MAATAYPRRLCRSYQLDLSVHASWRCCRTLLSLTSEIDRTSTLGAQPLAACASQCSKLSSQALTSIAC
ncbi:hypothetical protein WN51_06959 [Melipona quadrifasciata]|uniref:Uncharacterized protein n=1 Tax=Melipona quadrifasciata TaxID=166423 RepID=A0A0N0BCH7_9HYME|nr:hypothetical protein WN51_06959 [Melipona quadrifasciata]